MISKREKKHFNMHRSIFQRGFSFGQNCQANKIISSITSLSYKSFGSIFINLGRSPFIIPITLNIIDHIVDVFSFQNLHYHFPTSSEDPEAYISYQYGKQSVKLRWLQLFNFHGINISHTERILNILVTAIDVRA